MSKTDNIRNNKLIMPVLFLTVILILFGLPSLVVAGSVQQYVPGELLVQYKTGITAKQKSRLRQDKRIQVKGRFQLLPLEQWQLPPDLSVEQTIESLRADPNVLFAEPNYRRYPRAVPAEGLGVYDSQKAPLVQAGVEQLWDIVKGESGNVIVAVIDDAINIHHEDLSGNMVSPWDFVENDADPSPADTCKDPDTGKIYSEAHGTSVTGVVGAQTNNGIGIAGAAWNVKVIPIRIGCLYDTAAEIQAVEYAISKGASIINLSYGGPMYSIAEENILQAIQDQNVLVITAAGNDPVSNDKVPDYPSGLDLPNIVSVAFSDTAGELSHEAQFGQTTVDFAAPGQGWVTTSATGSYDSSKYGSSFAAPLVSGIAALLKTAYPLAGFRQLRGAMLSSVTPLVAKGRTATDGKINAVQAYANMESLDPVIVINKIVVDDSLYGNGNSVVDKEETFQLRITLENVWNSADIVVATLSSPLMIYSREVTISPFNEGETQELVFKVDSLQFEADSFTELPFVLTVNWAKDTLRGDYTRQFNLDWGVLTPDVKVNGELLREGMHLDAIHYYTIDVPSGRDNLKVTLKRTDTRTSVDVNLLVAKSTYPGFYYTDLGLAGATDVGVKYSGVYGNDEINIRNPGNATYYIAVLAPREQADNNVKYSLTASFASGTRSGGCTLAGGRFDPLLWLMVFAAMVYLRRAYAA
ncbi:MAG: S8 family serine peptidase [Gammaproteobacteria bacterium]|nr:S8 family serine peptidase [Gammaproteobacteria bacterium]